MLDIPYCGTPPLPGGASWNVDPVLIALLGLGGFAIARRTAGRARLAACCGWAVLVLALISPLCNLSVALFSARIGQHMLLTLVAAPLIACGVWAPRRAPSEERGQVGGLALPTAAFAVALWAWHMPAPYAATFASDVIYWAMHFTLFGCAFWLWMGLCRRAWARPDAAALAALVTAVQMGLLGAMLTMAPRSLFLAVHGPAATQPWGLSPLEDQQLGGLLMWVPGGLVFAAVCVALLALALRSHASMEQAPTDAKVQLLP